MKVKKRKTLHRRKINLSIILIIVFLLYFSVFQQIFNSFYYKGYKIEYCEDENHKENLDRGLVAMYINSSHLYIGWRLLEKDPTNISFTGI